MKKAYEALIETTISIDTEINQYKEKIKELTEKKSAVLQAIDGIRKFVNPIPVEPTIVEETKVEETKVEPIQVKLEDYAGIIGLASNIDYTSLKTQEDCVNAMKKLSPSVIHKIAETIVSNKPSYSVEGVESYLNKLIK